MPLVPSQFKTKLKARINSEMSIPSESKESVSKLIDIIAEEVDAYIRTATVTTAAGIAVATAGSPTNQVGATTAAGVGVVS